ncbi:MAG: hypothetical protein ACHP7D_02600 [Lysobacterales bacterium]
MITCKRRVSHSTSAVLRCKASVPSRQYRRILRDTDPESPMKAIALFVAALCTTGVFAQAPPQPALDLDLPSKANASAGSGSTVADDPPGTYYGDVGGKDAPDSRTTVSGSVTTTAGYAKGYGSGFATDAEFNMSTQLKNGKTIEMNIGVMRSNGLPNRWGRGYGSGFDAAIDDRR